MKSPIMNDPIALYAKAFEELFPDIKYKCIYIQKSKRNPDEDITQVFPTSFYDIDVNHIFLQEDDVELAIDRFACSLVSIVAKCGDPSDPKWKDICHKLSERYLELKNELTFLTIEEIRHKPRLFF